MKITPPQKYSRTHVNTHIIRTSYVCNYDVYTHVHTPEKRFSTSPGESIFCSRSTPRFFPARALVDVTTAAILLVSVSKNRHKLYTTAAMPQAQVKLPPLALPPLPQPPFFSPPPRFKTPLKAPCYNTALDTAFIDEQRHTSEAVFTKGSEKTATREEVKIVLTATDLPTSYAFGDHA